MNRPLVRLLVIALAQAGFSVTWYRLGTEGRPYSPLSGVIFWFPPLAVAVILDFFAMISTSRLLPLVALALAVILGAAVQVVATLAAFNLYGT